MGATEAGVSEPEEGLREGQVEQSGQRAVVGMGRVLPGNREDATEARRQEARERYFGWMKLEHHDSSLRI